ncbi:MAG: hypothetical protein RL641_262 [Candidatus Parcubacteria bacterium]|jgi:hypothetical protein
MSWYNVDNKHKKKYDRNDVACTESYEREYIIETILVEFPHLTRQAVESAVKSCCSEIAAPRPREKFLACLSKKLGV